jgi:hypothetical protein
MGSKQGLVLKWVKEKEVSSPCQIILLWDKNKENPLYYSF